MAGRLRSSAWSAAVACVLLVVAVVLPLFLGAPVLTVTLVLLAVAAFGAVLGATVPPAWSWVALAGCILLLAAVVSRIDGRLTLSGWFVALLGLWFGAAHRPRRAAR